MPTEDVAFSGRVAAVSLTSGGISSLPITARKEGIRQGPIAVSNGLCPEAILMAVTPPRTRREMPFTSFRRRARQTSRST